MVSHRSSIFFKAAAALASFTLESPTKKPTKKAIIIDDERRSVSPASLEDEKPEEDEEDEKDSQVKAAEELAALRKRFVGEVDLPESTYHCSYLASHGWLLL